MSASPPQAISRADAAARFASLRAGGGELLGILDAAPVLVIDLDSGWESTLGAVPELLPCVVIGIGSKSSVADLPGLDIVLSASEGPSAVVGEDPQRLLGELLAAIEASPAAAVTLAQVLRCGEGLEPAEALLYESLAYSSLQASEAHRRWLGQRPAPIHDLRTGDQELVELHRVGAKLELVLNRPERRNAFGSAMRDALCQALDLAAGDPSLSTITLRGAGPDFSSGGDLTEFGLADDPTLAHLVRSTRSVGLRLAALRRKLVARLHGACIGAGIELPAFAGTVLADPDSRFQLPELAMGLIPGAGGTVSIPRRIGRHRTAWLAMSGASLDAGKALAWGLVDRLVAGD